MEHDKSWSPIRASRSGPAFSHIFFADDLFLFVKADAFNCRTIKLVLDNFCQQSGQLVNSLKSKVFFSKRVPTSTYATFSDLLGIPTTPNPGKYLGFPLIHGRIDKHSFNFLIDKVQARLAG